MRTDPLIRLLRKLENLKEKRKDAKIKYRNVLYNIEQEEKSLRAEIADMAHFQGLETYIPPEK